MGNLVNRTVAMVHRYRSGAVPSAPQGGGIQAPARARAEQRLAAALHAFDLRAATGAVVELADEGNRYVEERAPWTLARAERKEGAGPEVLDGVLAELVATCRTLARLLEPFVPDASARLTAQVNGDGSESEGSGDDRLPAPIPAVRKLGPAQQKA
ncbi:hypothetical protein [Nocardiopsis oceani]